MLELPPKLLPPLEGETPPLDVLGPEPELELAPPLPFEPLAEPLVVFDPPAPFTAVPPLPLVDTPAVPPVVNGGEPPSVLPFPQATTHATEKDRTGPINVLAMRLFLARKPKQHEHFVYSRHAEVTCPSVRSAQKERFESEREQMRRVIPSFVAWRRFSRDFVDDIFARAPLRTRPDHGRFTRRARSKTQTFHASSRSAPARGLRPNRGESSRSDPCQLAGERTMSSSAEAKCW